jgi:hypothetical protein
MSGKGPHTDGKSVEFSGISPMVVGHAKPRSKSPKGKRCKPCSVLLLNINASLKSQTLSLGKLDKQFQICKRTCQQLELHVSEQQQKLSSFSSEAVNETNSAEDQEYEVVIKQEPLSPENESGDTGSEMVGPLSELIHITRNMESCSNKLDPSIPVKAEVMSDAEDERNEEVGDTTQVLDKKIGINSDYRIASLKSPEESAQVLSEPVSVESLRVSVESPQVSVESPSEPVKTRHRRPASEILRNYIISKTAVVQPTVLTTAVTSTSPNHTPTSSKLSATSVLTSTSVTPAGVSAKINTQSTSTTSAVKMEATTSSSKATPEDVSILQLMNGQMVLVPTNAMKQLSTSIPTPPGVTGTIGQPQVALPNVGAVLPMLSPMTQPTLFLHQTVPTLVAPAVTPPLCNIVPGNQPGMSNPIILIPQTGNPSTQTILLPTGENQVPNIFAIPNPAPSAIQIPNIPVPQQQATSVIAAIPQQQATSVISAVPQQQTASVIPAVPQQQTASVIPGVQAPTEIKTSIQIPNTAPVDCASFLRLTDGQLVPIVSNPSPLFNNTPVTSTVKSTKSPQILLAVNSSASTARPLAPLSIKPSTPPTPKQKQSKTIQRVTNVPLLPMNVKPKQDTPQFLQLPDGRWIPVVKSEEQIIEPSVQTSNQTPTALPSADPNLKYIVQEGKVIPSYQTQSEEQRLIWKSRQGVFNSSQRTFVLMDKTLKNTTTFHDAFFQTKGVNEKKPNSGSESSGKKPQPVILQTNRSRQIQSTQTAHNRWDTLKASNSAPCMPISSNPDSKNANATHSSKKVGASTSKKGISKPISKRKSVNVVREEFDSHSKKKRTTIKEPYFTHEVVDAEKKNDSPEKDEEGRPKFVFMRNVKKPIYRPVLLNSTIEEKGLRIPDSMLF